MAINAMSVNKKKGLSKKSRNNAVFLTLLLAGPLVQFFIFYVYVHFNSILLAFKAYDLNKGVYYYNGLANFIKFLGDVVDNTVLKSSINNSFIFFGVGLVVSTPLCIMFAYALFRKVPMSGFFKVMLYLPSMIAGMVFVLTFKYLLEKGLPFIAGKLLGVGDIASLIVSPDTAMLSMIVFSLWTGFGSSLILYLSAMTRIPDSLIEYARLEGASALQEFGKIVMPLIYPTFSTFLILSLTGIFTNQHSIYSFYGDSAADSNVSNLGYFFFVKVIGKGATLADYPYASAAGLVFTFILTPVTLGVKKLLEKVGPVVEY